MTGYPKVNRRECLSMLIGLVAFGLTRPTWAFRRPAARHPQDLAQRLASVFSHQESARIIGREYLKHAPAEADPRVLVELLCASCEGDLSATRPARLHELLQFQQRRDFERGQTVQIQGWILSQSEARLCALAALC